MSSNVLLIFFDGKCKYFMGEVLVWVQIFKNYFIIFKIKYLKNTDVLQPDSDYHVEKGPAAHMFLKLIQHSKCKN